MVKNIEQQVTLEGILTFYISRSHICEYLTQIRYATLVVTHIMTLGTAMQMQV